MNNHTMKAVGLKHYLPTSDPNALLDIQLPVPVATGRDLLIQVEAISVNPVDTKVRAPKTKVEEDFRVLGWDAAGIVLETGEQVELFKKGDKVYYAGDITRPGSNSQFQLIDERLVGHMPATLNFAQAAALPLTGLTASEALFERLEIPVHVEDKTLLIIGGAGGVGSIAIQLARQVTGLKIIATASRPESAEWCKSLGADLVVNHHQDFVAELRAKNIEFVDYILCLNTTSGHWKAMSDLIIPHGKICSIVEPEAPVDLNLLKSKSASFTWEFMFTRSLFKTPDMIKQHEILEQLAALIEAGKIKTSVNKILRPINAENLRATHSDIESGTTIGKIVLENW